MFRKGYNLTKFGNNPISFVPTPPYIDERGIFARNYDSQILQNLGLDGHVAQANISINRKAGTIRGFHFLNRPYSESKTLYVISGSIHLKVIDLRKESKNFMTVSEMDLVECKGFVNITEGCAVGFQTLEDNSYIQYFMSKKYIAEQDRGIRYDDPLFNLKWPLALANISMRDKSFPNFSKELI